MVRVDAPISKSRLSYERRVKELEGLGFNPDYLASYEHNLSILKGLTPEQLERVKKVILAEFVNKRFNKPHLIEPVKAGDLDAMAKGLRCYRLNPVYYVWKNPLYRDLPDPVTAFYCGALTL